MQSFLRQLYSQILFPMGWLVGLFLTLFSKKIRQMYIDRSQQIVPPANVVNKNAFWIHCSSGEFEYARSIIKLIKQQNSETPVVVSYMSPSYKKVIASDDNVDFCFPLPWDFFVKQKELLKKINPKAVMVARTDFWPQFLYCCKVLKIPTIAFSVRSTSENILEKLAQRFRLKEVQHVFCVGADDQLQLKDSGIIAIPLGDSRWDRVFERLSLKSKIEKRIESPLPILIAGSTWPKDENILIDAISDNRLSDAVSTVIIPHEVDKAHLNQLTKTLTRKNLKFALYSQVEAWDGSSILVVDQTGVLADFYRTASAAFVGGSFDRSVHSVMEPIGAGVPVIVGPRHTKSREALDFKRVKISDHLNVATEVNDRREFADTLLRILKHDRNAIKKVILAEAQKNMGASSRILNQTKQLL